MRTTHFVLAFPSLMGFAVLGKESGLLGPSDAILGMTELLGTTVLSGKHAARILREAQSDFWPEIGSGRRGGIKLRHLVCFWMANALSGSQPSNAPQVLSTLERMKVLTSSEQVYFMDYFLELVRKTTKLIGSEKSEFSHELPRICIVLSHSKFPMIASVEWINSGAKTLPLTFSSMDDLKNLSERVKALAPSVGNKLHRTQIIINGEELISFAQFASKAEDDDLNTNSDTPPGSGTQENTTPETKKPAGTGIRGGLQNERSAPKVQTAALHKAQSAIGKGRKQSLRPSDAGSGAGQRSTSDVHKEKTQWVSHSVSRKVPVACSDMFERLTA